MQNTGRSKFHFIPSTTDEQEAMLQTIGLRYHDIVDCVAGNACVEGGLKLPEGQTEDEVVAGWDEMMSHNSSEKKASLLGAGSYMHFIPTVVPHLASLPGFLTAYTPYQPEVSQGTLQSLFEFQSFMVELTGMELSNCSMYDGASSAAEAVLMAHRVKKADRVLVAASVHPNYIATVRTYLEPRGVSVETVAMSDQGQVSQDRLQSQLRAGPVSAVLVQSPNYFGVIEDFASIASVAHEHDALFVEVFTEAMALGLLKYGVETGADIVAGEGQSLGLPMCFGGPHLGIFTTLKKYNREFPGRIVGESVDTEGRRAFVITLRAREQDNRREKANSNICSNHSLNALTAAIYLGAVGQDGLRALACENVVKMEKLVRGLETTGNFTQVFKESLVFNEAALASSISPADIRSRLGGLPVFAPLALPPGAVSGVTGKPYTYLFSATELLKESIIEQVLGALS